jgi:hypothetical protein
MEVVKVATPLLLSVPVPSRVAPDLKVTVPLTPLAAELTVAVKVTGCPEGDGFWDELIEDPVDALFTFWLTAGEVEPR